jgi:hypothetical protein
VHRPAGKDHSAVLAFSSELDQWLDTRPVRQAMQPETAGVGHQHSADLRVIVSQAEEMLAKVELLVSRSEAMQRDLARMIESISTMEKSRREIRPARVEAAVS